MKPYFETPSVTLYNSDCLTALKALPDGSIQTCVTSPPYYGLRDYKTATWEGGAEDCDHVANPKATKKFGNDEFNENRPSREATTTAGYFAPVCPKCGAVRVDHQIGLEDTPEAYVTRLVEVFREVRRVLRDDGTLWVNIGDSYANPGNSRTGEGETRNLSSEKFHGGYAHLAQRRTTGIFPGLKPKDLIGIPWRVAFALQADGWWLRQDIIWCLSGGTWLYAQTQKGAMPMTVKDLSRLDPSTVKLWNGQKWTQLLGMSKSDRRGNEIELVLRSGERVSCTPTHKFPTNRGLLEAKDIVVGDTLQSCKLPEPEDPKDCVIDNDAAWFAGLYIAEGSMSGDTIQIAGHIKEQSRWACVQAIAKKFGGTANVSIDGNSMNIRVYGKILNAILSELVSGSDAHTKCFASVVWRYSDEFLNAMLEGYLSGDGHKDGDRWRLGFCRNYNLERDLRTVCARLGYRLTLNPCTVEYNGQKRPAFRGEIRKFASNHHNVKDKNEVMEIRKSRCRHVYDLGVEDDPHLFALASGVLTHNSKPNPMPESVTDRCTKAHEYIFLLSKSARYFYDSGAVNEVANCPEGPGNKTHRHGLSGIYPNEVTQKNLVKIGPKATRNRRSVWSVATKPYSGAHFAVFPPELITPCILAGAPLGGTVLDPFAGSGTTLQTAKDLGRKAVGIELNPDYCPLIVERCQQLTIFDSELAHV